MKALTITWLSMLTIIVGFSVIINHYQNQTIQIQTEILQAHQTILKANTESISGMVSVGESQGIINDRFIAALEATSRDIDLLIKLISSSLLAPGSNDDEPDESHIPPISEAKRLSLTEISTAQR